MPVPRQRKDVDRIQLSDGGLVENSAGMNIPARVFEFAPDAILLIDAGGRISNANAQTEKMFGYDRTELSGQVVEILIPERYVKRHIGYRDGYIANPKTRPMGAGVELFGKRKDGTEFPVDIMLSPLDLEDSMAVMAVVRDATERKRVEAEAEEAREMYLKEVHHRVKNNLQVISSLLFLQTCYTTDRNSLEILEESRNRVKSIALIHERLYRSPTGGELDFSGYVRDLVMDLFRTYGMDQSRVTLQTDIQEVPLGVDTAIPCGLVLNELVSNALKHAFPDGRTGTLVVRLRGLNNDEYELVVEDDGIGLPDGSSWESGTSLGLKLVHDLARQLEGTVEVDAAQGTRFSIRFRELHYEDRSRSRG